MVNVVSYGRPLQTFCKAMFNTWRPPFRPVLEVPSGYRKRNKEKISTSMICKEDSMLKAFHETAMATVRVHRTILVAVHNSTFSSMKDWKDPTPDSDDRMEVQY